MASSAGKPLDAPLAGLRRDLERPTAREAIAAKIAALIASGVLSVGDELPGERELAATLAVSRETVRGAIGALAARGILQVGQGTRTRVVGTAADELAVGIGGGFNVNRYGVDDVHAARLVVEQRVVADAAKRMSDDVIAGLEESLATQETCLDDPVRFLICDREFHVTIYRTCGNALLADMATDLYTYLLDYRRRVVSRPGSIEASIRDHRAILGALRRCDPVGTAEAFETHEERIYLSTREMVLRDGQAAG